MAKNAAISEDANKAMLESVLNHHFLLLPEVEGKTTTGHTVRLDYWAYPKPHIIDLGWEAKPFGIEVKSGELEAHNRKTAIAVIAQAITYRWSNFPTKKGMARPDFVLIFPSIGALLGLPVDQLRRGETFEDGVKYGLERLAGRFRVGELFIREGTTLFEVRFNGARQFDSIKGKSAADPLGKEHNHASR